MPSSVYLSYSKLCCRSASMEINSKQELTDYRLFCVLCLRVDKLEEMQTRDVAMEMRAEAENANKWQKVWGSLQGQICPNQVRFRLKLDSV